jgi:hypothetical protein
MTAWTRAGRNVLCGRCGAHVNEGRPIQVITIAAIKNREFVRCEGCADGLAPPDLPSRIEPGSRTSKMVPIRKLALGSRPDWKQKASQA